MFEFQDSSPKHTNPYLKHLYRLLFSVHPSSETLLPTQNTTVASLFNAYWSSPSSKIPPLNPSIITSNTCIDLLFPRLTCVPSSPLLGNGIHFQYNSGVWVPRLLQWTHPSLRAQNTTSFSQPSPFFLHFSSFSFIFLPLLYCPLFILSPLFSSFLVSSYPAPSFPFPWLSLLLFILFSFTIPFSLFPSFVFLSYTIPFSLVPSFLFLSLPVISFFS